MCTYTDATQKVSEVGYQESRTITWHDIGATPEYTRGLRILIRIEALRPHGNAVKSG